LQREPRHSQFYTWRTVSVVMHVRHAPLPRLVGTLYRYLILFNLLEVAIAATCRTRVSGVVLQAYREIMARARSHLSKDRLHLIGYRVFATVAAQRDVAVGRSRE
jgi:hypothetical protein